MSKAKAAQRRGPAPVQEDEVVLPPAWRRRPWIPILIIAAVVAVALASGFGIQQVLKPIEPSALSGCKTSTQVGPHAFIAAQPICILPNRTYQATITTSQGQIVIKLLPEIAPVTVNNFVVLAANGYYNGLTFWKSEDWVVQGGDPNGNGTGGPGYTLPDEPNVKPVWGVGAVGMARVPGGPINGSQFFIEKGAWPGTGPTAIYNRFATVVTGQDKVGLLGGSDTITSITIKVA
jgi:cyclophilin family peptidyl-prolyl cis-trans isomerase